MITIYTDGSSKGNPGPGGWGVIIASDDKVIELGGREEHTTNNRMELTAAIRAVSCQLLANSSKLEATIYCDASYVVKGITEWISGWQKNNWKTANKKPVENKDLWEELFEAVQDKHLVWKIIAGHSGIEGNERCDVIATTFADGEKIALYNGTLEKYSVRLSF